MASASIYIQTKTYKDGTVPIFLRLIIDRQIYLNQICKAQDIGVDRKKKEIRKGQPDYMRLNLLISRTLQDAKEYLIGCDLRKVTPDAGVFFGMAGNMDSIAGQIERRADELYAAGQYRTSQKYQATGRKIRTLGVDAKIHEITTVWIRKLDAALIKNGNNPNTRAKDMAVVSAVLTRLEVANPFERYRKPGNKTSKAKLSMEEFTRLQEMELTGKEAMARDIFVFATLARGMRSFDIITLRADAVHNGRLSYRASKTGKIIDMAISQAMALLLDKYVKLSLYGYAFPVMNWPIDKLTSDKRRYLNRANTLSYHINKSLQSMAIKAKIDKHITMHVARHTFAYLADQGGVPLGTIQQLLDHGKIGTTQVYVESLRKNDELDKAVENLF